MARGWESKSVEDQQTAASSADHKGKPRMTAEQITRKQTHDALQLSRQRVLQQLQTACNPNHRSMLEKALADLDAQLTKLG